MHQRSDAFSRRIHRRVVGGGGPAGLIDRRNGCRQLEVDLVTEVCGDGAEKSFSGTTMHIRTKTDTGRRGEYPKALERTVLKELGNLTP